MAKYTGPEKDRLKGDELQQINEKVFGDQERLGKLGSQKEVQKIVETLENPDKTFGQLYSDVVDKIVVRYKTDHADKSDDEVRKVVETRIKLHVLAVLRGENGGRVKPKIEEKLKQLEGKKTEAANKLRDGLLKLQALAKNKPDYLKSSRAILSSVSSTAKAGGGKGGSGGRDAGTRAGGGRGGRGERGTAGGSGGAGGRGRGERPERDGRGGGRGGAPERTRDDRRGAPDTRREVRRVVTPEELELRRLEITLAEARILAATAERERELVIAKQKDAEAAAVRAEADVEAAKARQAEAAIGLERAKGDKAVELEKLKAAERTTKRAEAAVRKAEKDKKAAEDAVKRADEEAARKAAEAERVRLEKERIERMLRSPETKKQFEEAEKVFGAIGETVKNAPQNLKVVSPAEVTNLNDIKDNEKKWAYVKNAYGLEPDVGDTSLFWYYKDADGDDYRMPISSEDLDAFAEWRHYLRAGKEVKVIIEEQIQDLGIDLRGKDVDSDSVKKQIDAKAREVFEAMLEQLEPGKYPREARYALAISTLGATSMNGAYEKVKEMIKKQLEAEKKSRDVEGVEKAKDMTVPTVAEIKGPEDIRKARAKWENVVNKYGEVPTVDDISRGELYWRDFDASTPKEKLDKDKRGKDEVAEFKKWKAYLNRRQYCEGVLRNLAITNAQTFVDLTDPHKADQDARDVAQKMARTIHNPDPKLLTKDGLTKENYIALMHDTMGVEGEEQAFLKFLNLIKLTHMPKGRAGKNVFEVADRIDHPPKKLADVIDENTKAGETLVSSMYRVVGHINKLYGRELGLSMYEIHRALIDIIKCRGSRAVVVQELEGIRTPIPAEDVKKIYIDFLLAKNTHFGEQDLLAVMIAFEPKKPYVFNIRKDAEGWVKDEKKTGKTDDVLDDFCEDGSIFAELQYKLGMDTRAFTKFIMAVAPKYKKIRTEIINLAGGTKFTKEQVEEVARNNGIEPAERLYTLMMVSLWADKIGQAYKHALYLDQEGGVMVPQVVEHQGPDIDVFGKITNMDDFKKQKERWDKVKNQFGETPDKKEVFGKTEKGGEINLTTKTVTSRDVVSGGEELYWEEGKPLNANELNEYRKWRAYIDQADGIAVGIDRIFKNVGIDTRGKAANDLGKDSEEVKAAAKEALKLILELSDASLNHTKDGAAPDSPADNRFTPDAIRMLIFYAIDNSGETKTKADAYKKVCEHLANRLGREIEKRVKPENIENAGDMVVPTVLEIRDPGDIANCLEKWNNVVNAFGEKPGADDNNLYWKKDMPGEMGNVLAEDLRTFDDERGYKEFTKYYTETRNRVLHSVDEGVGAVRARLPFTDGKPEELEAAAKERARALTEELLTTYKPGPDRAMLFHTLGLKNEQQLYLKLLNMIKLVNTTDAREHGNVYDVAKDKKKYPPIPLKEYLKQSNGTRLVADSLKVLGQLHDIFGEGLKLGLYDFKQLLCDVIKSRGGRSFEFTSIAGHKFHIGEDAARSIYRKFLMLIDPDIGEKEVLAILLTFMPNKAFVYDIHNDQKNGWEITGKKKMDHHGNVLRDFENDGAMFKEIAEKTGMNMIEAAKFLDIAAPKFEALRNAAGSGNNLTPEIASRVLNHQETPEEKAKREADEKAGKKVEKHHQLEGEELKKFVDNFNKLRAIPLWIKKIGPAWKHSKYLTEGPGVQQIIERQGPARPDVEQIDIVFVSVEEKLNRIAERLADERLDQELKEMSYNSYLELLYRFDKPIAKWWKRNAMEGYRDKYRREFVQRLKTDPQYRTELMALNRDQVKDGWVVNRADNDNLPNEGVRPDLNGELDAIAERFGIAWADRANQADYLTENENIDGSLNANAAIGVAIEDLSREYLDRGMSDNDFRQRVRAEIMPMVKAAQGVADDEAVVTFLEERGVNDIEGRGLLNRLRAHRNGLIELDLDNLRLNLGFGRAQNVDVKTQTKDLTATDRWTRRGIERLQRSKFWGRVLSPPTIAIIGFAVSNVVTQMVTSKWIRYGALATLGLVAPTGTAAAVAIATGAIAGGAMGYFRQNKEQLHLKAQKERRRAMSNNRTDDNKSLGRRYERRLERDQDDADLSMVHPLVSARTLTAGLNAAVTAGDSDALVFAISNASALNNMSEMGLGNGDNRRLDLIRFTSNPNDDQRATGVEATQIEAERLALVRAINRARRTLNRIDPAGAGRVVDSTRAAMDRIRQDVAARDGRFRNFKMWENLRSGLLPGVVAGGLISGLSYAFLHDTVPYRLPTQNLTPAGNLDLAHFEAALNAAGVGANNHPEKLRAVMDIVKDPASWNGNALTPAAEAQLHGITPTINYSRIVETVQNTVGPTPINGGSVMNLAQLQSEIASRAAATGKHIDMSKITLVNGHLSPAAMKELTDNGFTVREVHAVMNAPGVTAIPNAVNTGYSTAGWQSIITHGNDNQPHGPGHILDELRFLWDGQPKVDANGMCHFSISGMLNKNLPHSHLPTGIEMPSGPNAHESFRVLLQGHDGGKLVWREFPVGADGKVSIPGEYFDPNRVGYVPKMGSYLPGLKTEAIAAGFYDKNHEFQVLASVAGDKGVGPIPVPPTPDTLGFTADETFKDTVTKVGFNATRDSVVDIDRNFGLPIVMGGPMQHLEYGLTEDEKKKLQEEQKKQPMSTLDKPKGPMTSADRQKFRAERDAARKKAAEAEHHGGHGDGHGDKHGGGHGEHEEHGDHHEGGHDEEHGDEHGGGDHGGGAHH